MFINKIKFREQAHSNLVTFRQTNKMEEKQRQEGIYMTRYKFKNDLNFSEFLQTKRKHLKNIAILVAISE